MAKGLNRMDDVLFDIHALQSTNVRKMF